MILDPNLGRFIGGFLLFIFSALLANVFFSPTKKSRLVWVGWVLFYVPLFWLCNDARIYNSGDGMPKMENEWVSFGVILTFVGWNLLRRYKL